MGLIFIVANLLKSYVLRTMYIFLFIKKTASDKFNSL